MPDTVKVLSARAVKAAVSALGRFVELKGEP